MQADTRRCKLYRDSSLLVDIACLGESLFNVPETNVLHRADHAMQAYRGALGELREDMQVSPFASWTQEQLQVPLSLLSRLRCSACNVRTAYVVVEHSVRRKLVCSTLKNV